MVVDVESGVGLLIGGPAETTETELSLSSQRSFMRHSAFHASQPCSLPRTPEFPRTRVEEPSPKTKS